MLLGSIAHEYGHDIDNLQDIQWNDYPELKKGECRSDHFSAKYVGKEKAAAFLDPLAESHAASHKLFGEIAKQGEVQKAFAEQELARLVMMHPETSSRLAMLENKAILALPVGGVTFNPDCTLDTGHGLNGVNETQTQLEKQ